MSDVVVDARMISFSEISFAKGMHEQLHTTLERDIGTTCPCASQSQIGIGTKAH